MITDEISKMGSLVIDIQTHIAVADADLGGGRTIFRYSFVLFSDINFWLIDLKIFLKAPLAPIYTNFEGGDRAEITRFFGRTFPKSA